MVEQTPAPGADLGRGLAHYRAWSIRGATNAFGLTFSEFARIAQPFAGQPTALRRLYVSALCDADVARRDGQSVHIANKDRAGSLIEFVIYPVVRHTQVGELIKFVQCAPDSLEIESVIIPMWRDRRRWNTLCVSSQIGCAMGCTFCETAQLGRLRNLTAAEIVGQLIAARRVYRALINNIVFMGMGEPFDNFEEVAQAVRVLTDPLGLSFGMSRITISTVGRIDGIRRLAALGWRRINLAVSLNAPNDEIRSQIMPINRAQPMAELRRALLDYPLRRCQFIMVEYVLIPGVNDARDHARELADYLRGIKCCVNVIAYNPRVESPWPAPSEESVEHFLGWLRESGQFCKKRITKGREHMAACGQLGNRALVRQNAPRLIRDSVPS